MKDIKLSDLINTCKQNEELNPVNPCGGCKYKEDFCDIIYGKGGLPRSLDSIGKKFERKFADYTLRELSSYCKNCSNCRECKFRFCCNGEIADLTEIDLEIFNTNIYIEEGNK